MLAMPTLNSLPINRTNLEKSYQCEPVSILTKSTSSCNQFNILLSVELHNSTNRLLTFNYFLFEQVGMYSISSRANAISSNVLFFFFILLNHGRYILSQRGHSSNALNYFLLYHQYTLINYDQSITQCPLKQVANLLLCN